MAQVLEADCVSCGKHVVMPFTNGWSFATGYDDMPKLNGWWCDTCSEQMEHLEMDDGPSRQAH